MTGAAEIQFQNLTKIFRGREIIKNFNLEIYKGTFLALVGPSGCGKSTLLRLAAGLESPTQGQVLLTKEVQTSYAFVFQDPQLLPWRTVLENVLLPFELGTQTKPLSKKECRELALQNLSKVHLKDVQDLFPHELSGGMKMRVSLARALMTSPHFLLLDEPFAALDENTRFEMQNQLLELWKKENMTVLFVTHSLFEAAYLAQRIVMLKGTGAQIVLDQEIRYSQERDNSLRTSLELNNQVRNLFERLQK